VPCLFLSRIHTQANAPRQQAFEINGIIKFLQGVIALLIEFSSFLSQAKNSA